MTTPIPSLDLPELLATAQRRPTGEVRSLLDQLDQVYFDRSRAASDDACPRQRYWANEYLGVGLSPQGDAETKLYLPMGSAIHRAVEVLAQGGSGLEASQEAAKDYLPLLAIPGLSELAQREQQYLLSGLIEGYAMSVWPLDLLAYDIVSVEDEVVIKLAGGEQVVAKPDLLLRRKSDGKIIYKEYKSTSFASEGWVRSFSRSAQLLTGALACQVSTGLPLHASIIQGLYKGSKYKGRPTSLLIYGYRFPDGSWSHKWARGGERVGVWEYPGGQPAWLAQLPPEDLLQQFPSTPPIMFNGPLMRDWLAGQLVRERVIASQRRLAPLAEAELDHYFPMHPSTCEPAMGSPCGFIGVCFNPQAKLEPLLQGYRLREPHLVSDPAWPVRRMLAGEEGEGEGDGTGVGHQT